ncbi:hypothetical protein O7627_13575 [Solwaraspora sp. WMMD1047]|uniref:lipopolysaccharide biosynthesis protein n=1 Tax=Solwaraspora sp. WMMD1047 TaxID=3016102 RepID=UPI0024176131|nr:hypothetical protein [Solwaraspora sp. WMMD1047]MDG4830329.1 hypothetical protein [Solwaraspora sp. WMMD1047]
MTAIPAVDTPTVPAEIGPGTAAGIRPADVASAGAASAPVVHAMVRTAMALMTSTVASAALGFVFWVVAARWFPAEVVGRASAAVSSMSLLAGLAQLNLTSLYARFLPTAGPNTRRLIVGGYLASAAMSVALATGFLALGLGAGLIGAQPAGRLIFTGAVVASAIFFIQDGVLAALRRPSWVPAKNVVASAAKLALLPLLAGTATGDGLLLAWALPMLATMLAVNWWILARLAPARGRLPGAAAPVARREVLSFASAEYVNGFVTNAVAFLPPVLVAGALGPADGAYFYIPWVIGVAGTTLLWNVVTSFVVEAASDGSRARAHVNRAATLVGLVVGPAAVLLALAAGPLLRPLGPAYAEHGADALRLIGLSLPFTGVVLLYAAFAIMEKRMWRMVAIQSAGAVAFLAGSWLGLPRLGIVAPALALLAAQAAVAAVLLPGLIRRYRATGSAHRRPDWATGSAHRPDLAAAGTDSDATTSTGRTG